MSLTVFAVMKVTLEIPVRASGAKESFEQMYEVAKREADAAVRKHLSDAKINDITFSHAVVRNSP